MPVEDPAKLVATAQALLDSAQMAAAASETTVATSQKLLLATAQSLRVLLFLMETGNFGPLPADTKNDVINLRARLDNALGANKTVGK
jgi:hypothetical protein